MNYTCNWKKEISTMHKWSLTLCIMTGDDNHINWLLFENSNRKTHKSKFWILGILAKECAYSLIFSHYRIICDSTKWSVFTQLSGKAQKKYKYLSMTCWSSFILRGMIDRYEIMVALCRPRFVFALINSYDF